jgi:hypothetical protein
VLDMVGQLLAQSVAVPAPIRCVIQATGMQWVTDDPLRIGDMLRVSFYPNRRYPQPVVVYARVVGTQTTPDGAGVSAAFEGLSAPVRDGLEKLIFRRHRRMVARSRRGE